MEQQKIITITANELLAETLKLKNEGYRLVAITCSYVKEASGNANQAAAEPAADGEGKEYALVRSNDMELTYSFDNSKDFVNLRILTDTQEEIMSISVIYSFSFLYENEIKELFGVQIKDMSIDFKDQLYKIPVKTPFNLKKEDK